MSVAVGQAAASAPAVTEATVSLLEPAGEGCEWIQLDPLAATRRVLVKLAVDCQGGATALSRDGKRGAVRFWRGGVSAPVVGRPTFPERFPTSAFRDRLFLVDLTAGTSEELPLPPAGELIEFGFDASGRLLGLSLQKAPAPNPEHPLLAHAFAWEGGAWTKLDSKESDEGSGTGVLAQRKTLGERSNRVLDPRFTPEEIQDDVLLDGLYALSPEQPDGEWTQLRRGKYTLVLWGTPFGEDMLATGLLRAVEKGKAVALPGQPYKANDLVSLQARGAFLLVSLADSGGHPRLYRGRKLVWSSDTARAVTFWPR